ncbi:MAG: hypothetical protein RLY70_324 [Planctomycetota bacterium]
MTRDPFSDADSRLDALVRPADWRNPRPADRYHWVVVGGGTAGLVAAAGAASLGARVALIERSRMGGDCLNHGCVPSKALLASAKAAAMVRAVVADSLVPNASPPVVDFPAVMRRMRELRSRLATNDSAVRFQGLGVDVFFGQARFVDRQTIGVDDARLRFRRALIATGARASMPPIPGLATADPLTNESLFDLEQLPRRLAVLGAGPIGCEMAQAFARFGAAVVIIESGRGVLPREDRDAAVVVERALQRDGVRIRVSASGLRVVRAENSAPAESRHIAATAETAMFDGASSNGSGWTIQGEGPDGMWAETVDRILVASGRRPNIEELGLEAAGIAAGPNGVAVDDFLRTSNRLVYAAGDVCSPYRFTHAADFMARAAIRNALFWGRSRFSSLVIPWCTYTDPEVARVGLSEQDAASMGVSFETLVQPLSEVDRAILESPPFASGRLEQPGANDEPDGFVKVLLRRGTDRIIGATLVAPHAGEMVGELTLALQYRLGLGKLGNTIHPYPTVADAIRKLGDQYQRRRLTPGVRSMFRRWFAWWR